MVETATRSTQNDHLDAPNGARWDGHLENAVTKTDAKDVATVELTFLHSYQELRFI